MPRLKRYVFQHISPHYMSVRIKIVGYFGHKQWYSQSVVSIFISNKSFNNESMLASQFGNENLVLSFVSLLRR